MIYPWQQQQWQHLLLQMHNHTLPHALLLAGPQGMGKQAFAMAWAACLLCCHPQQAACGACRNCKLFISQTHPDLLELKPHTDSKIIKVEQIRELLVELGQTAQQGNYQVVVIDPAEAMNTAAANALLKNLEEPPGRVVFLLVSHQPSAIPATIRSRCQRINFAVPDYSLSLPWLQQQLPQHNALALLAMAENIPLRALAFAENGWFVDYDKMLQQMLQLCQGGDPLTLATNCLDEEFPRIYSIAWSLLHKLVQMKLIQQRPQVTSDEIAAGHSNQLSSITQLGRHTTFLKLFALLDMLMEIKQLLDKKVNLNLQLTYEKLFIEWSNAFSE